MKRFNYILYLLLAMFIFVACGDDEPVKDKEEELVDYGDVKALFEAKLLTGEPVETIDMGETLTMSDISLGRPDSRQWTITSSDGSVTIDADDAKVQTFFFPVGDMDYNVKLMVERSSDSESDMLLQESFIHVNKIDVMADFVANGPADVLTKAQGGGDFTVGRGLPLTFLNKSKGAPNDLSWEFEGGTPLTSDENDLNVVYNKDGLFEAKLTATRSSDGSTHEVTKLIRVIQEYMYVEEMTVDNNIITIQYDQEIMLDPSAAVADFSVDIQTAAGTTINVGISTFVSDGHVLTITLDQDTYSDDVVTVSYDGGQASLVSTDPAFIGTTLNKAHAIDVNNMFFKGKFDGGFETWVDKATNIKSQGGRSGFNLDISELNSFSGDKSGYFEIGYNGDSYADIIQNTGTTYHAINPGDEYHVGFWLYIEEMVDPSISIGTFWRLGVPTWWNGANSFDVETVANTEVGKWIYVTAKIGTGLATGNNASFMWRIKQNKIKLYMDNMKMYPASSYRARPIN